MQEQTQRAVEACLAGVGTVFSDEERERLSRPPYPLPDRLLPHRDVVLAEVERLREEGRTDRTCVRTIMDTYLREWSAVADRLTREHGRSLFITALLLIFSASDMSAGEFEAVIPQVPGAIDRNKLRSQLINVLLSDGEVSHAERISDTLEPFRGEDQRFFGHRRVAHWFARQGDASAFFARWPLLAASRERHHMAELKQTLVESVARIHGWRAALEVVGDRRIGPRYRASAFAPLAEAGEFTRLFALLSSAEGRDLLDEVEQLEMLTVALVASVKRAGIATREPFFQVLHRVLALDPSEKATMRARDGMLLKLWPAYPDADALALARRSARTPAIRRELTELHPEITRPDANAVAPS